MTPGKFDIATAREYIGDDVARTIEAAARADAEADRFAPPPGPLSTYSDGVLTEMMRVVYAEQHRKRTARLQRTRV